MVWGAGGGTEDTVLQRAMEKVWLWGWQSPPEGRARDPAASSDLCGGL